MGEVNAYLYSFLTSKTDKADGQFRALSTLIPAKEAVVSMKRVWVGLGALLGGLYKRIKNLHMPEIKGRILRSSNL